MTMQVFGTKKCKETQKALRYFKERNMDVQFIDLNQKGPSAGELKSIAGQTGWDRLLDTESALYQKLQLQYMSFDLPSKLLEVPLLLKTPIVRAAGKATVGYQPDIWKTW